MKEASRSKYDDGRYGGNAVLAVLAFLSLPIYLCGDSLSLTGTLPTPEDVVIQTVTIGAGQNIAVQTWGFGGGINSASAVIPAGGFDPFVGLFQGTGPSALFLDGTADNLSNYTSEPSACPPAGLVTIGSVAGQCGDVNLQFTGLAAGDYTVLLTDANYLPAALFETTGFLGDGFSDLTGGAFQTCFDENNCNTDTANWAMDIATSGGTVPEPASLVLTALGLAAVMRRSHRNRLSRHA